MGIANLQRSWFFSLLDLKHNLQSCCSFLFFKRGRCRRSRRMGIHALTKRKFLFRKTCIAFKFAERQSLLLCKERRRGEAVTEGLISKTKFMLYGCDYQKISFVCKYLNILCKNSCKRILKNTKNTKNAKNTIDLMKMILYSVNRNKKDDTRWSGKSVFYKSRLQFNSLEHC